jgi:aarF domain-containing kinase
MEGDFVNVVISMLLLEGIRRALDPKMDLLKRYLKRLLRYSA